MLRFKILFLFFFLGSIGSSFSQSLYYYNSTETLNNEKEKAARDGNQSKKSEIEKELEQRAAEDRQLQQLDADLNKKIAAEDYLEAQKIKETIELLKSNQRKTNELRKKLDAAVATEDYEGADKFKQELTKLKSSTAGVKQDEKDRAEAERKQKEEASRQKKQEEERAKEAADQKAQEEAELKRQKEEEARKEADEKKRLEDERKAKEEADRKVKEAAEIEKKKEEQARIEAEKKRKLEEERAAKEEAERKAKEEAELKKKLAEEARLEAERKRLEEEQRAREEAERKEREEAERKRKEEEEARRIIEAKEREFELHGITFFDDFSQIKEGWRADDSEKDIIETRSGKLLMEGLFDNYSYRYLIDVPINTEKDFIVEGTTHWVKGLNNNGYGIDFASNDEERVYYSFQVAAIGYYSIIRYENKIWREIKGWTKSTEINKDSQPNKLKIWKENNEVSYYINDVLIDKMKWTGGLGTDFGFRVFDLQRVEFDDFKVRGFKNEKLAPKNEEVVAIKQTIPEKNEIEKKVQEEPVTTKQIATSETQPVKKEETKPAGSTNKTVNIFQIKNEQAQLTVRINKSNTSLTGHKLAIDELKKKKKLNPEQTKYVTIFDSCTANINKARSMTVESQGALDELSALAAEVEQQVQELQVLQNSK